MRTIVIIACCAWISGALSGCASTKDTLLPQDGPTIAEIYARHQAGMGVQAVDTARAALAQPRPLAADAGDLAGYTRTAFDEIETRFARLPNPTLVMFIFPHLAGPDAVPIPGYATSFPMYERTHYALPGEVNP